jgi:3-isopropylmalate/(R)-2-methylmalate dehydratase small subunit
MEKFEVLQGIGAPLPMNDVDTDKIIPARFLRTIKRSGLGRNLFNDLRYGADGAENPDFVLNKPPYREAKFLVAGKNFGCGSSREHAPWALSDFGIRCVIAPSFADIFHNNCFKNGLLPLALAEAEVERLMQACEQGATLTADLPNQRVTGADSGAIAFDIDPFRKHCLLNALDDISLTLEQTDAIARFEEKQRAEQPWLYG